MAASSSVSSATSIPDSLVGVELAKSGRSFCGWCDTPIFSGTPRVLRRYQYSYGGSQPPGGMVEYMHAACAFHFDDGKLGRSTRSTTSSPSKPCVGCATPFGNSQPKVVSLFSPQPPRKRFEPNPNGLKPLLYCYKCVRSFVSEHAQLLNGFIGSQQMAAPVAWQHRACSPFDTAAVRKEGQYKGEPSLPRNEAARKEFLALFACGDGETQAVERHVALRHTIALEEQAGRRRQDYWAERDLAVGKRKREE